MVWHGTVWHGTVWHGPAWHGTGGCHSSMARVRHDTELPGMTQRSNVRYIWYGRVWFDMAWYGRAYWYCGVESCGYGVIYVGQGTVLRGAHGMPRYSTVWDGVARHSAARYSVPRSDMA